MQFAASSLVLCVCPFLLGAYPEISLLASSARSTCPYHTSTRILQQATSVWATMHCPAEDKSADCQSLMHLHKLDVYLYNNKPALVPDTEFVQEPSR